MEVMEAMETKPNNDIQMVMEPKSDNDIGMPLETKPDVANPWNVESLEHFLYYNCPECEVKHETKAKFIIHAVDAHPRSHPFIPNFDIKEEKDFIDDSENGYGVYDNFDTSNDFIKQEDEDDSDSDYFIGEPICELEAKEGILAKPKPKTKPMKRKLTDPDYGGGDYHCRQCSKSFVTKQSLDGHIKRMHTEGGEPRKKVGRPAKYTSVRVTDPSGDNKNDDSPKKRVYRCDDHNLDFNCVELYYRHNKRYHPHLVTPLKSKVKSEDGDDVPVKAYAAVPEKDPHQCCLCGAIYEDKSLFKLHMAQDHLTNDVFNCQVCNTKFLKTKCFDFVFHLTSVHGIGEYIYKCETCGLGMKSKGDLKSHISSKHLKTKTAFCEKCGKGFQAPSALLVHMKSEHSELQITPKDMVKSCDKCHQEFNSSALLDCHLEACLNQNKDFQCKFCEKKWVSHLSLELHLVLEHRKLMYGCEICGWVTPIKTKLGPHKKRIHDKEFDFFCHICAKPLSCKNKLIVHLANVHGEGEKKFKCSECDKRFATNYALKRHFEYTHDTSTIYQCDQCLKTFQLKDYLTTHIRTVHKKYKPNKCDICDEAYLYKRDLIKHKANVHHIHM